MPNITSRGLTIEHTNELTSGMSMEKENIVFDKNVVEILKNSYNNVKKSFLEVAEELKMRRNNDQVHEEKINKLITEMFELKRAKEEDVSALTKTVEGLKQGKMQLEKELNEKTKIHEEEKNTHSISLNSSSKGVKVLKDEILALQLAKYGLEKKIKEQDHQIQLERSGCKEVSDHVAQCQVATENARKQFSDLEGRVKQLSEVVGKTEDIHEKLIQVNKHHKCIVQNYRSDTADLNRQLTSLRAEHMLVKDELKRREKNNECYCGSNESVYQTEKLKEMELIHDQLVKEIENVREEKKNLLVSLSESSELLSTLQLKYDELTQVSGLYQLEIDELRSEVNILKKETIANKSEIEKLQCKITEDESTWKKQEDTLYGKITQLKEQLDCEKKEHEKSKEGKRQQYERLVELELLNDNLVKKHASHDDIIREDNSCSLDSFRAKDVGTVGCSFDNERSVNVDVGCMDIENDGRSSVPMTLAELGKESCSTTIAMIEAANEGCSSHVMAKVDVKIGGSPESVLKNGNMEGCSTDSTHVMDYENMLGPDTVVNSTTDGDSIEIVTTELMTCVADKNQSFSQVAFPVLMNEMSSELEHDPCEKNEEKTNLTSPLPTSTDSSTILSNPVIPTEELATGNSSKTRVTFAETATLIIDTNPEDCRNTEFADNTANHSILKSVQ